MLRHLGYVAIALSLGATTNRTCRLRNVTAERLRALSAANLRDLRRVLHYNVEHDICLYRISSQLIPFASHPVNGIRWWTEFADLLADLAAVIARHRLRVSVHPGQFTVLNSPDPAVVEAAIQELAWHVRLLDALGTDSASKIVVHVGGRYGSKAAALDRFAAVAAGLPASWRRRLVVENDERLFSAEDVLDLAERTGLPVVFDWLHHTANPGRGDVSVLIDRCFDTWGPADGPPKVHYSSQAPGGRRGAHADYVDLDDFLAFLRAVPDDRPFDCMLEAKAKDRALLRLRAEMAARGVSEVATV